MFIKTFFAFPIFLRGAILLLCLFDVLSSFFLEYSRVPSISAGHNYCVGRDNFPKSHVLR